MENNIGMYAKENLSELVAEYIKDQIISEKYQQGQHIPETEIATDLGISRAPVREGIKMLQNFGIVEFIPRKGNFVTQFNKEDIKEIFDIRLLLEGDMYGILIRKQLLTEKDFENLTAIIDEMVAISDRDDDLEVKTAAMSKKDIEFHKYIWRKANSKRRAWILEQLHFQLQMVMAYDTRLTGDLGTTAEEHYDIVEALKTGDIDRCKLLLRQSIESYRKGLI